MCFFVNVIMNISWDPVSFFSRLWCLCLLYLAGNSQLETFPPYIESSHLRNLPRDGTASSWIYSWFCNQPFCSRFRGPLAGTCTLSKKEAQSWNCWKSSPNFGGWTSTENKFDGWTNPLWTNLPNQLVNCWKSSPHFRGSTLKHDWNHHPDWWLAKNHGSKSFNSKLKSLYIYHP